MRHAVRRQVNEHGSATVYATLFIGLLAATALLATAAGGVFVAHRKADAAADLAALAGAQAIQGGHGGCERASAIAEQNHARLVSCRQGGDVLTVQVAVPVRTVFAADVDVEARARAGPVS